MGKYNSSDTRVAPVFSGLFARDRSGHGWLNQLLQLGSLAHFASARPDSAGALQEHHPAWWGKSERSLAPPLSLLRWLVQNADAPRSSSVWGSPTVRAKREELVRRNPTVVAEALTKLDKGYRPRAWYVLEGQSRPDACLETDRILLVVEGKRTERHAASATTWMRDRSQILRHMDAALEVAGQRAVLGLHIVEGSAEDTELPSPYWMNAAEQLRTEAALQRSLPHRDVEVRNQLRDGFLGVTTWQRVCRELSIAWPPIRLSE